MNALLLFILGGMLLFVGCLWGATIGALVGWLVGFLFDDTMRLLAQALGIADARPYQLGAMFGFIGGFFRSSLEVKGK